MRALAAVFPWLGIELALRAEPQLTGCRLVLSEPAGAREWVVGASPAARRAGVRPGMPLSEARARVAELEVRARQPEQERAELERLADEVYAELTPKVSLAAADALLLELAGTERLRAERETAEILAGWAAARRISVRQALCDAPAAALALARGQREPLTVVPQGASEARLRDLLGQLATRCLAVEPWTLRRLEDLGLERVEQLLALPRASLPSRFGPELLHSLDALVGRRPTTPEWHQPQPLPWAALGFTSGTAPSRRRLTELAQSLVSEVVEQLERRSLAARSLRLSFEQDPAPPTPPLRLELELSQASHSAGRLGQLLAESLERFELKGVSALHPVSGLVLETVRAERLEAPQGDLFARQERQRRAGERALSQLLAGFTAELGSDAVAVLEASRDPRPERATRALPAAQAWTAQRDEQPRFAEPRPLRLLSPTPLEVVRAGDGPPLALALDGRLVDVTAASAPERIETGWWEREVRRDYRLLTLADGRVAWVFEVHRPVDPQDPVGRGFFLHGWAD